MEAVAGIASKYSCCAEAHRPYLVQDARTREAQAILPRRWYSGESMSLTARAKMSIAHDQLTGQLQKMLCASVLHREGSLSLIASSSPCTDCRALRALSLLCYSSELHFSLAECLRMICALAGPLVAGHVTWSMICSVHLALCCSASLARPLRREPRSEILRLYVAKDLIQVRLRKVVHSLCRFQ